MSFLNYSLLGLISYLGLMVGLIIMKASKEEQKDGIKYFIILQKTILFLMVGAFLYFLKLNFYVALVVLVIVLVLLIRQSKIKTYALYPILGIMLFISIEKLNLLFLETFLIFCYGIVTGSLLINFKKKNYLEIMLKHVSFLIVFLLLLSFSIMF